MKATGHMKNIEVGSKVILEKNLNDTWWDDADWTYLLHYELQWRARVNVVIKRRLHKMTNISWPSEQALTSHKEPWCIKEVHCLLIDMQNKIYIYIYIYIYINFCLETKSGWGTFLGTLKYGKVIIIIIIIRHELGLERPLSALSISLFVGLPSRHRPFVLQFSIIFGILLLFILVTCRSQFDLHLLSFSSIGYTFNSSKISSLLL